MLLMAVAKRKPLSFNTTLRNPERIAGFLSVLCNYEGKILTNEVIEDICCEVLIEKLYVPNSVKSNEEWANIYNSYSQKYTKQQALDIMEASPQRHKEAGFDYGWPSRFDTWYKLIMEFGLCYYEIDSPIEISPLGKDLVAAYKAEPIDDDAIQNVFLNAMAKFQTSTPFRKNANQNVPLLLLLKVINLLKCDEEENGAGIFRKEISFFLCWPNNDAEELYQFIKKFRAKYGYNYSDEVIYEKCLELFLDENHTSIDSLMNYIKISKLLVESTDEYIRKMRITGVVSLRGNGRFLDFNTLEMDKITYLITNYGECVEYEDKHEFYKFLQEKDDKLFKVEEVVVDDLTMLKQNALNKYANEYSEEKIIKELEQTYRGSTSDEMLKFIDAPARLEFLSAVALVKYFEGINVIPNYSVDDEGLPRFTARGGMADIECHRDGCYGLLEVTLMTGAANQTEHEMTSISDHLKDATENSSEYTMAVFVAPILQERALDYMEYMNDRKLRNDKSAGIVAMKICDMIPKFKEANRLQDLAAV